jgi:hypothetical protein
MCSSRRMTFLALVSICIECIQQQILAKRRIPSRAGHCLGGLLEFCLPQHTLPNEKHIVSWKIQTWRVHDPGSTTLYLGFPFCSIPCPAPQSKGKAYIQNSHKQCVQKTF